MTKRSQQTFLAAALAVSLVFTLGCPQPEPEVPRRGGPAPSQVPPMVTAPEPATPEAPAEEPAAEKPPAEEPAMEEPAPEIPAAEPPKPEEQKAEEKMAPEPKEPEVPKAEAPKPEPGEEKKPEAEEPKAEEPKPEKPEEPKAEKPKAEEAKPEAEKPTDEAPMKEEKPKEVEPKEEAPKPKEAEAEKPAMKEKPKSEEAEKEEPKEEKAKEEPKTKKPAESAEADKPKQAAPKKEKEAAESEKPAPEAPKAEESAQAGEAELFLKLPEGCNTPDGMCLLEDGSFILSMPNFNELEEGSKLMKITADNKVEKFLELGKHPETGDLVGPLGVCLAPSGDLFLADYQMNGKKQSRVLRIPMKDGKPGEPVPAIEGFHVSNAVICHDGYLYVSETQIDTEATPATSGVLRFKLEDLENGVIELAEDVTKDPHFLGVIEIHNEELKLGADGLCFDKQGNLYCGNFADGTLHRFQFDEEGNVKSNEIFATADFMKSCDGLFFNPETEEVYVTDSMMNAVHAVDMDANVRTLAKNGDTDGLDGGMDQPCEVLLRGNELIVSNMDWPVPGCINQEYDEPCTLSVIHIEQ